LELSGTRYARARDGTRLVYKVLGDGPVDLVYLQPWYSQVEIIWEEPRHERFLRHAVRPLGIEVRAGVQTGEVETVAGKAGGLAVVIGSFAGPSEVLASQTVRDLTAGSGIAFTDAGERELKGVPDRWRLYRVVS
jgi:class 3 adenylate cyclase